MRERERKGDKESVEIKRERARARESKRERERGREREREKDGAQERKSSKSICYTSRRGRVCLLRLNPKCNCFAMEVKQYTARTSQKTP